MMFLLLWGIIATNNSVTSEDYTWGWGVKEKNEKANIWKALA